MMHDAFSFAASRQVARCYFFAPAVQAAEQLPDALRLTLAPGS
jgi:hypothetical protein